MVGVFHFENQLISVQVQVPKLLLFPDCRKNRPLFQRPIMLDNDDDPEADLNGLYAECNGDICYNACKSVRITNKSCVFIVQDSTIIVDLENIKINKRFIEYSKCIFKDLLVLDI